MSNTTILENNIEIYENRILELLDEYISIHDIESMNKETQNRWNACLLYIYNNSFKLDKSILYQDNTFVNNGYNLDYIDKLCDLYIYLCYEYDKEISILGFSKLTGINQDTFHNWANNERLSSKSIDIYKKLTKEREESLSNMLISGKRNPVGILGSLNRHYGWNMGQPKGIDGSKAKIGFSDLPQLSENSNNSQLIEKLQE